MAISSAEALYIEPKLRGVRGGGEVVSVWVSLISCWPPYATMSRARTCIYYKHTSNGTRCVLLSPEEWRLRGYALKDYCLRGGNGCPVLARVLSSSPDCDFLSSIVNKRRGLERGA